jgi:hypothetical protein
LRRSRGPKGLPRKKQPQYHASRFTTAAWNFPERSGEIDDSTEASQFLANKIEFMIALGQHSRLMLSNRAITAFLQYKKARTIEFALVSR